MNNHYEITIDYHHREDGKYRVVGVLVSPSSRNQKLNEKGVPEISSGPMVLSANDKVLYTYSTSWRVSYLFSGRGEGRVLD